MLNSMKKMILEPELQTSFVEDYSSFSQLMLITEYLFKTTSVFRDLFCMFTFISRL